MKRRIQNLNQPLGRKGARRRVRTRTALFLFLMAMVGTVLMGLLGGFVPEGVRVWLGAIASVAFFALPAYLGLCEIDGDQTRLLSLRRLSGAQVLWLAASGALLICPATLMNDVMAALAARFAAAFGMQAAAAAQSAGSASLLLPIWYSDCSSTFT